MRGAPTKAQIEFLKKHLRATHTVKGLMPKFYGRRTYTFVARLRDAGLIEIVDPDDRFPYSWQGTKITDAGRAALDAAG